ncbi:DDT domain-containing protein PTM [Ananas comosus]|uniref:DDT domain-containing protein PTM n=1 Tax=Ananas comosus TaxID=4615 RepID=A0A6P5F0A2_ANACO|nr:DDT domain-containing protein PTM [Ananas comosus]XP_020086892.1 DDT domain-containing protein PTM [Ananas comosus]XP_020086893.1 DDT domain-containing protein PTM [Ananas comosus]
MELVGSVVRKTFPGLGTYEGVVESYDASTRFFKVLYEDGDTEEVDFGEIASMLGEVGELPHVEAEGMDDHGRRPKKRRRAEPDSVENGGFGEGSALGDGGGGLVESTRVSDAIERLNDVLGAIEGAEASGECSNGDLLEKGSSQGLVGTRELGRLEGNGCSEGSVDNVKGNGSSEGFRDTQIEETAPKDPIKQGDDTIRRTQEGEQVPKRRRGRPRKVTSSSGTPLRRRDGDLVESTGVSDGIERQNGVFGAIHGTEASDECSNRDFLERSSSQAMKGTPELGRSEEVGSGVGLVGNVKESGFFEHLMDIKIEEMIPKNLVERGGDNIHGTEEGEQVRKRRRGRPRKVKSSTVTPLRKGGGNLVENTKVSGGIEGHSGFLGAIDGAEANGKCSYGDLLEKDSSQGFGGTPEMVRLEENGTSEGFAVDLKENGSREPYTDTQIEEMTLKNPIEQGDDAMCGTEEGDQGRKRRRGRPKKVDLSTVTPLRRSARRANTSLQSTENSVTLQVAAEDNTISEAKADACVSEDFANPELPSSSNDLDLEGLPVLDLFSVYTCLRSFSRPLFLSPFGLEAFVAALRCKHVNSLIDSIHFSILQALKRHLEFLSEEGSQSATDCIRNLNWELLDLVTWPLYLAEYLLVFGSSLKSGIKLTHLRLLNKEYYEQPADVKLDLLRCLCDNVIEVEEIRSELNLRMSQSEYNTNMTIAKRRTKPGMETLGGSFAHKYEDDVDGNSDECCLCGMDGNLLCCDGCPAAFHSKCVGVAKDLLPEGDWYCPDCLLERSDGLINLSKACQGAEVLGIDPHGRMYFRSCGYLLVSDSCNAEASCHYYKSNDLLSVMGVLKSSDCSYEPITTAICASWDIPVESSSYYGQFDNENHNIHGMPDFHNNDNLSLPLKQDFSGDKDVGKIPESNSPSAENLGTNITNGSDLSKLNEVILNHPDSLQSEGMTTLVSSEILNGLAHESGVNSSDDADITGKEVIILTPADAAVENGRQSGSYAGAFVITEQRTDGASQLHFDLGSYVNYYSFGRIASSVAEELTHISSECNTKEVKKSVEDVMSVQLKAIPKKSIKLCCYPYRELSFDAQKEKCGWCYSCRTSSDADCLFKNTDGNLLESSGPPSEGQFLKKDKKNHIASTAHYILSIEDRLRSLLSGPWQNPHFSNVWREAVLKASDVTSLKNLLLTLESSLRRIALSAEWLKPVDFSNTIGSASYSLTDSHESSNNGSSKKQGRKSNPTSDRNNISDDSTSHVNWWRGGKLSRQVYQWKRLPRSLASKSGRQAGFKKIPSILYPDGSDIARRSKCIAWRAAVEMSKSVAQLLFQIKEFDSHIKWTAISSTQPFPPASKDSKKLTKLFKKVIIRRKSIEGTNVKYLLDFGKRDNIPPIVARYGVILQEPSSDRKKYWLSECHVPLDLLKAFEEKRLARVQKKKDSDHPSDRASDCKLKKTANLADRASDCISRKTKRSEGFSLLFLKAQQLAGEICGHCNEKVLVSEAVNCQYCNGFFHRKHFKVPRGATCTTYTCSKCKDKQSLKAKPLVCTDKQTSSTKPQVCKDKESLKAKPRGKKLVKKKKKNKKKTSEVKMPLRRSERIKRVVVKLKKAGVKKRGKQAQSKRGRPKKFANESGKGQSKRSEISSKTDPSKQSENEILWRKRKRTVMHYPYWLNGLHWTHNVDNEHGKCFRKRKVLLPSQHIEESSSLAPVCCLCSKGYCPEVIYVACEKCEDWFHADAYCVTLENLNNLIGFTCHKCRKRSVPVCPYSGVAIPRSDQELAVGGTVCFEDQNSYEERKQDGITSTAVEILPSSTAVELTNGPIMMPTLMHDEEKTFSSGDENASQIVVSSPNTIRSSNEVGEEVLMACTHGHLAATPTDNPVSSFMD